MVACRHSSRIVGLLLFVSGCALQTNIPAVVITAPELPDRWQAGPATAFDPVAEFARLLELDEPTRADIRRATRNFNTSDERANYLMTQLLGSPEQAFLYKSDRTTAPTTTYQTHSGNCLSLTLLAYAMARELGFKAVIQEAIVPPVWERRLELDYINRHVNVKLMRPASSIQSGLDFSRDIVVDFEPSEYSRRVRSRSLEPAEVLAMYRNNLGAEALAGGDLPSAFAQFRAATIAYRQFDSSWINLALLYRRVGDNQTAEQVLLYARQLNPDSEAALLSLHGLMSGLGRPEAAALMAERVQRQEQDPYYWLRRAEAAAAKQQWKTARDHFLVAAELAQGFPEIHRGLAEVYQALGEQTLALEQLAKVAEIEARFPADDAVYVPVSLPIRP